ncbi:MAG: molecular chaperone TorD family protein [Desulfitobacterium sp.]|nr:molecular chaperone TorD family protein [Desulfitobacterium sp.]
MSNFIKELPDEVMNVLAISDFYQLLSISLRLPDNDLAKGMLDGSYGQDAVNILEELHCNEEEIAQVKKLFEQLATDKDKVTPYLIEMRREYTRLFDDPKKPALGIYETVFLHNPEEEKEGVMLFMSPAALDAERCYKEAGVGLVKETAEPADHMATELEFMMYLYGKKGQALQKGNEEELDLLKKQINEFKELHLHKWALDFFKKLQSEAKLLPYQGIAQLGIVGLEKIL